MEGQRNCVLISVDNGIGRGHGSSGIDALGSKSTDYPQMSLCHLQPEGAADSGAGSGKPYLPT